MKVKTKTNSEARTKIRSRWRVLCMGHPPLHHPAQGRGTSQSSRCRQVPSPSAQWRAIHVILRLLLLLLGVRKKRTHLKLAIPHVLPGDSLEPFVLLDVLRPALEVPHTFRAVCRQEFLNKILCVGVKVGRELDLASQNFLINPEWVVVEERRISF